MKYRIGCLIMAAGNAARFGENKLLAEYHGKALVEHALDCVPKALFDRILVVTQYPQIENLAAARGFDVIENDRPEDGISYTIRLGTEALADCDAILYLVADQPMLKTASVEAIVEAWKRKPQCIAGAASGSRRGNPNLFPKRFFEKLCALEGDRGGSRIISAHEEDFLPVQISPQELFDCDTKQELLELQ